MTPTANMANSFTGTDSGEMITFMFMIFIVSMATIGTYIIASKMFASVLLSRKKKKLLKKIRAMQLSDGNEFKMDIKAFDKDGFPTLIETKTKYEFI